MKTLVRIALAVMILAGTFPAPAVADGGEPPPAPCLPRACHPLPVAQTPGAPLSALNLR
jgi:hypothetical protein